MGILKGILRGWYAHKLISLISKLVDYGWCDSNISYTREYANGRKKQITFKIEVRDEEN